MEKSWIKTWLRKFKILDFLRKGHFEVKMMNAEKEVMIEITKAMTTTEMRKEIETVIIEIEETGIEIVDEQPQKKTINTVEAAKAMTETAEWENNLAEATQKKVIQNEDQTAAIRCNKKIKVRIN